MIKITGIDHIYITVSNMKQSELFYDKVFVRVMGFEKNTFTIENDVHIQYYNRHFGYVVRPSTVANKNHRYAPGLHHLCFRVDSIDDVKLCSLLLNKEGVHASDAENYQEYAHDYWATYFSDPDGVKLEITNFRQERRDRFERLTF